MVGVAMAVKDGEGTVMISVSVYTSAAPARAVAEPSRWKGGARSLMIEITTTTVAAFVIIMKTVLEWLECHAGHQMMICRRDGPTRSYVCTCGVHNSVTLRVSTRHHPRRVRLRPPWTSKRSRKKLNSTTLLAWLSRSNASIRLLCAEPFITRVIVRLGDIFFSVATSTRISLISMSPISIFLYPLLAIS